MFYSSAPAKGPIVGRCIGSTAAAVWHQLTVKEAEAGLAAADVLLHGGGCRRGGMLVPVKWCSMNGYSMMICW